MMVPPYLMQGPGSGNCRDVEPVAGNGNVIVSDLIARGRRLMLQL